MSETTCELGGANSADCAEWPAVGRTYHPEYAGYQLCAVCKRDLNGEWRRTKRLRRNRALVVVAAALAQES